jgi:hypothetical protein
VRNRVADGLMVFSGIALLLSAVLPWDGLRVVAGSDALASRTVTVWRISPLCWAPLLVGLAAVVVWVAWRSGRLRWRRVPPVVSALGLLGFLAVVVGLATGPSDDYGWYATTPLSGDPQVVISGWRWIILLAAGGLLAQAAAGLVFGRKVQPTTVPAG